MARPLRIQRAGGWYHVTARGIEQRPLFRQPADYARLLELLPVMSVRYRVKVHAYALRENHLHRALSTPEANLSAAMHGLETAYGFGFYRRYQCVGPLFQGRFKAVLFEGPGEAWPITRYVHVNPVRVKALGLDRRSRQAEQLWEARRRRPSQRSAGVVTFFACIPDAPMAVMRGFVRTAAQALHRFQKRLSREPSLQAVLNPALN